MQMQEEPVPEEVLRVLLERRAVRQEMCVHRLQEYHGGGKEAV